MRMEMSTSEMSRTNKQILTQILRLISKAQMKIFKIILKSENLTRMDPNKILVLRSKEKPLIITVLKQQTRKDQKL